jgi:hypothetical protein
MVLKTLLMPLQCCDTTYVLIMSQLKIDNFNELIAIKQDQLAVNSQDKWPNLLQLVNAQE